MLLIQQNVKHLLMQLFGRKCSTCTLEASSNCVRALTSQPQGIPATGYCRQHNKLQTTQLALKLISKQQPTWK
jgi:hypothetical protein